MYAEQPTEQSNAAAELRASLSPPETQDDFTEHLVRNENFLAAKRLPDGTYVGLQRLMFTVAICIGVTPITAYTRRYCYNDATICIAEYRELATGSDEPTGWVARRPPQPGDYSYRG